MMDLLEVIRRWVIVGTLWRVVLFVYENIVPVLLTELLSTGHRCPPHGKDTVGPAATCMPSILPIVSHE